MNERLGQPHRLFKVVHESCVESVDQVDTYREIKYLACVPQCPCI